MRTKYRQKAGERPCNFAAFDYDKDTCGPCRSRDVEALTEHIGLHGEEILLQFPSAHIIYHRGIDNPHAY